MQVKFNKLAWALATVGLVTGLAGCGGGGGGSPSTGFDNDPVQISSKAVDVTLAFVDANDPTKLITAPVSYKLTGQAPGMLTTLPGSSGKGTVINTGAVRTTATGTESLLADFSQGGSFTVTPDSNWISYPPTVTQGGSVVIKLLKKDTVGNSTYVTASNSDSDPLTAEIPGAAKISIDPNNNLGKLSIAVVKFADSKVPEMNALNQGTFLLSDQAPMARFVVTDSDDKVVKDFPKGVTLQIQLADQSLAEGNYSGVIRSYDEEAGWTTKTIVNGKSDPYDSGDRDRIENAMIIKDSNGKYFLQFTAYHLSIWSLAYTGAGYCVSSSLTLDRNGNSDGIDFRMTGTGANSSFDKTRTGVTDNTLSLFFVPDFPVTVIATKAGIEVGRLEDTRFCEAGVSQPKFMKLDLFTPTSATLSVNVTEVCAEDVSISRPGPTNVQFTPTGSSLPSGGWTGDDASIDIKKVFNSFNLEVDLTLGTTGTLKIYNRFTNKWDQWDTKPPTGASFIVDETTKVVNWAIATTCNVPTGTTGSTGAF